MLAHEVLRSEALSRSSTAGGPTCSLLYRYPEETEEKCQAAAEKAVTKQEFLSE